MISSKKSSNYDAGSAMKGTPINVYNGSHDGIAYGCRTNTLSTLADGFAMMNSISTAANSFTSPDHRANSDGALPEIKISQPDNKFKHITTGRIGYVSPELSSYFYGYSSFTDTGNSSITNNTLAYYQHVLNRAGMVHNNSKSQTAAVVGQNQKNGCVKREEYPNFHNNQNKVLNHTAMVGMVLPSNTKNYSIPRPMRKPAISDVLPSDFIFADALLSLRIPTNSTSVDVSPIYLCYFSKVIELLSRQLPHKDQIQNQLTKIFLCQKRVNHLANLTTLMVIFALESYYQCSTTITIEFPFVVLLVMVTLLESDGVASPKNSLEEKISFNFSTILSASMQSARKRKVSVGAKIQKNGRNTIPNIFIDDNNADVLMKQLSNASTPKRTLTALNADSVDSYDVSRLIICCHNCLR